ncbi:DNA mismatch repair protein MLH3 isoform X2 [Humulus lupulus]|uniref:DNA mismatch repair protein MLH3 isoform X2 n=1 Tax=Humulus lupulus TaxID=3486 RepID=UPI002B40C1D8|nr:DNA mismatch repair protein MLH3 isoform X2 [Humulus lupulus]
MATIQPLPQSLRTSLRSGIILFDTATVVEELVFNSLDAAASMVSVFVGVGTSYIKVVDDGSGIPRDDLVLLGERYATSKFDHLVDKDAECKSFGFRGEALASISDVSLLEVVTKASGRPNGYRKVMKGSKCLYLGIHDDRKDVGTTVVVRDLFYNQPIRRKYIQSSPKKVLQSIKKCVQRISLVHSKVSFKVVDIESEDVLLYTLPSSPLSLLTTCFGTDISTSLHELKSSSGKVKLSGYISSPCDNLSVKVFQYVYINSRYVCKGPIQKLVNQLAARFQCSNQGKTVNNFQTRKRSRAQIYPAFILNIRCPRSFYDLTFEPSKTFVEFKDWVPVLTLLDEAIQDLWKENISDVGGKDISLNGDRNAISLEDLDDVFSRNSTIGKKKGRIENPEDSLDPISSHLKMPIKEVNHLSQREQNMITNKCSHIYTHYFQEQENETDSFRTDNSLQTWDQPIAQCKPKVSKIYEYQPFISNNSSLSTEGHYLVDEYTSGERRRVSADDVNFSSPWGRDSFEVNLGVSSEPADSSLCCDHQDFNDDVAVRRDGKKPFLKSCSSRGSLPQERSLCTDDACKFKSDSFKINQMLNWPYDRVNISETRGSNQNFDFLSCPLREDNKSRFQSSPTAEIGSMPRSSLRSIPLYDKHADYNDGFFSDSVKKVETIGSSHLNLDSEWCSLSLDSISQATPWDVDHYPDFDILEDGCKSARTASVKHFMDREENDCRYTYDMLEKRSSQEKWNASCSYSEFADDDLGEFLHRRNSKNKCPPKSMNILTSETDWLSEESLGKNYLSGEMYKSQRDQNTCEESERNYHFTKRRSRSHSAPPFCRSKRKFLTLNYHSAGKEGNDPAYPEGRERWKPVAVGDSLLDWVNLQDLKEDLMEIRSDERHEQSVCFDIQDAPFKENVSNEFQDSLNCGSKWRNSCPKTAHNRKLHDIQNQSSILDISSGLLHLAGDSLVPESINKNSLKEAIVLQQIDKKYIPIVAGKTLAVVDQHAADERIRLEELRQKVLSGEAREITFLDEEKELMLPEIGHQLLHSYAKEIKEWGWICNIHAQDPKSFNRNLNLLHNRPTVIKLVAVPCILGVNLSDIDLTEFLQQLADTDGSSTIPPSVLRVLNSKACRGAIMFGDALLHSECSLLIEELKYTSLCFQCAHGRPTTAPLVNLEVLHKQIAKTALLTDDSNGLWHGLRRHELSVERAERRLMSASY